jgi:hypothetical protein
MYSRWPIFLAAFRFTMNSNFVGCSVKFHLVERFLVLGSSVMAHDMIAVLWDQLRSRMYGSRRSRKIGCLTER